MYGAEVRRFILAGIFLSDVIPGNRTLWRLSIVVAVVGVVVLATGLALGVVFPGASSPVTESGTGGADAGGHQNPAELGSEGNTPLLEQQLRSQLVSRTQRGAVNLTREDYERAREQLSDEDLDRLAAEYEGAVSDIDTGNGSRTVTGAQTALTNLTLAVAGYWEVYDRYEWLNDPDSRTDAVDIVASDQSSEISPDEINVSADRDLVDELERRSTAVAEIAPVAAANFRQLAERTGSNYTATIREIQRSQEEVTGTQQTLREEWYTGTRLSVMVDWARLSPTDTLDTRGRLTTDNGTPIANERVTLEVGEQSLTVRTDDAGWFRLTYTPTRLSANATTLDIEYSPPPESGYLGNETTVDIIAEPVQPTIEMTLSTDTAQFGERVSVTGRISADENVLSDVPYVVTVDGRRVGQGVTLGDGRIDAEFTVSERADTGTQAVRVALLTDSWVVQPANETATIDVASTPTVTSIDATAAGQGTVEVTGRLLTDAERPVPDQPVRLAVDGEAVQQTRTDGNGTFAATVTVPETSAAEGGEEVGVTVEASFDGAGTNLESSTQDTTATVVRQETRSWGGVGTTVAVLLGVVVLSVVLVGLSLYRRRDRPTPREGTDEGSDEAEPTQPVDRVTVDAEIDHAVELLEAGRHEAAVRAGYAAVRRRLARDGDTIQTHWEFYEHKREQLDDDAANSLRDVTESYERVAFADESIDPSLARDVVDTVRTIAGDDAERDSGSTPSVSD